MVRRILVSAPIALACTSPATAAERPAPPLSNADYWTFADDLMRQPDSWWDPAREAYIRRGEPSVRINSALLLAHAVAARDGHTGATRQDASGWPRSTRVRVVFASRAPRARAAPFHMVEARGPWLVAGSAYAPRSGSKPRRSRAARA
jgi:DNA-binding transcriptional LysR family regulator